MSSDTLSVGAEVLDAIVGAAFEDLLGRGNPAGDTGCTMSKTQNGASRRRAVEPLRVGVDVLGDEVTRQEQVVIDEDQDVATSFFDAHVSSLARSKPTILLPQQLQLGQLVAVGLERPGRVARRTVVADENLFDVVARLLSQAMELTRQQALTVVGWYDDASAQRRPWIRLGEA